MASANMAPGYAPDRSMQDEVRALIERAIGPVPPGTKLKTVLPALARRIRVSARRMERLWLRQCPKIYAHELDALRAAAAARGNPEIDDAARLERIAAALIERDAQGHGADIAFCREAARRLRALVDGARG